MKTPTTETAVAELVKTDDDARELAMMIDAGLVVLGVHKRYGFKPWRFPIGYAERYIARELAGDPITDDDGNECPLYARPTQSGLRDALQQRVTTQPPPSLPTLNLDSLPLHRTERQALTFIRDTPHASPLDVADACDPRISHSRTYHVVANLNRKLAPLGWKIESDGGYVLRSRQNADSAAAV
ncbi:MAG: hypothetical protein QM770_24655 [Tepidisphaeraceae bacterium]